MRGLPLDEQLEAYDRLALQALDDAIEYMQTHKEHIIAGGRVRYKTGYQQFGSKTWKKPLHEIFKEQFEEMCDIPAYGVMIAEKQARGWE